jgi:hypothetical protein
VSTTTGRRTRGDSTGWLPHRDLSLSRRTVCRGVENHGGRVSGQRALAKAGWLDPHAFIEILRIANAIGNAAAQSSAMNQSARGPNAP